MPKKTKVKMTERTQNGNAIVFDNMFIISRPTLYHGLLILNLFYTRVYTRRHKKIDIVTVLRGAVVAVIMW